MNRTATRRAAREFLLNHREDYDTAYRDFRWPEITEFNWALDHFDDVAGRRGGRGLRRSSLAFAQDDGARVVPKRGLEPPLPCGN